MTDAEPVDPLRVLRPEVAPCIACGYERGQIAVGTPCPECGQRSPPAQSLVIPAWHVKGGRAALVVAVVFNLLALGLFGFRGGSPVRFVPIVAMLVMLAARLWEEKSRSRRGFGLSVGGVTVQGTHGVTRLPWTAYRLVTAHGRELRFHSNRIGKFILRLPLDPATTKLAAEEADALRRRSFMIIGSSVGSRTLHPIQVCDVCGACRRVTIGGACRACGEAMPVGDRLLSGRSSPSVAIATATLDLGSVFGTGAVVAFAALITIALGITTGEWLGASIIAGTLVAVGLLAAVLNRAVVDESPPRLRDVRDLHWLLGPTELRVITPLGDRILPWAKVDRVERRRTRGRWIHVEAIPNDPRLSTESIWLANEEDVDAAWAAFNSRLRDHAVGAERRSAAIAPSAQEN